MSEVQEEHFLSGDPQPIDMKEMVTKPMEREKKEVFLTYTLQIYHKCYFKYFSFPGKCTQYLRRLFPGKSTKPAL